MFAFLYKIIDCDNFLRILPLEEMTRPKFLYQSKCDLILSDQSWYNEMINQIWHSWRFDQMSDLSWKDQMIDWALWIFVVSLCTVRLWYNWRIGPCALVWMIMIRSKDWSNLTRLKVRSNVWLILVHESDRSWHNLIINWTLEDFVLSL
jgi:hypothetical protein